MHAELEPQREPAKPSAWVTPWLAALLPACGLVDRCGEQERGSPEPIPHERLKQFLPSMEGWESHAPEGKPRGTGAQRVSLASASYEQKVHGQSAKVTLEILDGGPGAAGHAPFAVMAHSKGEADVHKRRIEIEGHAGIEEWNPKSGEVTVLLLVARRFVVTLKGKHVSPATVSQFLAAIDVQQLARLARDD